MPTVVSPGPIAERDRIASIDVLRGFALFGVFMVNAHYMAMNALAVAKPPEGNTVETLFALLEVALFDTKFVAIFSMLFGVGLVVQMQRAEAAERPFAAPYLRRLGVLFAMGFAHGCLLWAGDILLPYALMGLILLLFAKFSARVLFWIGASLAALAVLQFLPFALLEIVFGDQAAQAETDAEVPMGGWDLVAELVVADDPRIAHIEHVVHSEGPLGRLLVLRMTEYALWFFYSTLVGFNTRVLAAFFLGAALMKWGFFRRDRGLYKKLVLWGFAIGLPLEFAVAYGGHLYYVGDVAPALLVMPFHFATSLFLSAAYVGGIVWFAQSGALQWLARGLACVGRMSLTNYIGQSVAANVLFEFFGFGLFDKLSRPELWLIVCGVFAGQIVLSALWLKPFRMGPLEWFWRTLSYGKLQPILRRRG